MSEEFSAVLDVIRSDLTKLAAAALHTVRCLAQERMKVVEHEEGLLQAQVQHEREKAELIGKAYADGVIAGGNADTRKAQEQALIRGSAVLNALQVAIDAERSAVSTLEISVRYYEDVFKVLIEAVRRETK